MIHYTEATFYFRARMKNSSQLLDQVFEI